MKNIQNLVFTVLFSLLIFSIAFPADAKLESPKKQIDRGVSLEDIQCREGLELVIRTNGFAACVKPETADRMEKRGLVIIPLKFTDLEKNLIPIQIAQKEIQTIPASDRSIVNFYINDQDLNVAHNAAETVSTQGLFEFTINGVVIDGPSEMIETGPDTGQFYLKLELPATVNGKPITQEDIVVIRYLDESDYSGEKRTLVKSFALSTTYANFQSSGGSRIGQEFTIRLYEPDANRDSKNEDKIPLSELEFKVKGGIKTTLANPKFDANRSYLLETGPNTNIFEVEIKIPREIEGKVIHIGDSYEIKYIDRSTPSGDNEKVVLKGRIG